jgi:hypothetical protein
VAESDPAAAPEIYANAANELRSYARQPPLRHLAAVLASSANEFDARGQSYRAFNAQRQNLQGPVTKDDFEEQEEQQALAHERAGHLDDFEVRAARNEIRDRQQGRNSVSIFPEMVKDSTSLGYQINVKFNPTVNDTKNNIVQQGTVVFFQSNKFETQAFSIDIGVPGVPPLGTGVSCRPFGIITYGADAFQMSFTFDTQLGARLTGVGNYCSVLVGMGPPRVPLAPLPPLLSGVMTIGASLGWFPSISKVPVTFTSYIDDLAPGVATAQIVRPSRASAILPPQSSDPNGSWQIDQLDYSGVVRSTVLFAASTVVFPIPVSPETASIIVTNKGAVVATTTIPWQLAA